jgi:hypothetical protein
MVIVAEIEVGNVVREPRMAKRRKQGTDRETDHRSRSKEVKGKKCFEYVVDDDLERKSSSVSNFHRTRSRIYETR